MGVGVWVGSAVWLGVGLGGAFVRVGVAVGVVELGAVQAERSNANTMVRMMAVFDARALWAWKRGGKEGLGMVNDFQGYRV